MCIYIYRQVKGTHLPMTSDFCSQRAAVPPPSVTTPPARLRTLYKVPKTLLNPIPGLALKSRLDFIGG